MSVELIAEVSSNHGGSVALAEQFIHTYAAAGATWVKFQATRVAHLRPDDPQYDWFARAELRNEALAHLKDYCHRAGVKFLCTVYHPDEVPFLAGLQCEAIKIGSGESQDEALWRAVLAQPWRVFASDGLQQGLYGAMDPRVEALYCVSTYPSPVDTIAVTPRTFAHYAGYSDHTIGIDVPKAALAMGAWIVEMHVTLPDAPRQQPWDKTPEQFAEVRRYADFLETLTSGTPDDRALAEARRKYVGRWRAA